MKYIKLFEAFDSTTLSKILGYINQKSKRLLLNYLKYILKKFDFPLSKISDNELKILPYFKALEFKGENIIKFWFNENGDYINKTTFFRYTEIFKASNLAEYDSGTPLLIRQYSYGDYHRGYLYYDEELDKHFFISNYYDYQYDQPSSSNWEELGKYTFKIVDNYFDSIFVYDEGIDDPYKYNVICDTSLRFFTEVDTKKSLKNADFAIILDIDKLTKSDVKKVSKILDEREEEKEGAIAMMSDDEIRSINFNKILAKINFDLNKDLKGLLDNINTTISRLVGNKHIITKIILDELSYANLKKFIDTLYKAFKYGESDEIIDYSGMKHDIGRIKRYIKKEIKRNIDLSKKISKAKNRRNNDYDEKVIDLFNEVILVSESFYEKHIKNFKFECLEDIVILFEKLYNIKESDFFGTYEIGAILEKFLDGREVYRYTDSALSEFKILKRYVERL